MRCLGSDDIEAEFAEANTLVTGKKEHMDVDRPDRKLRWQLAHIYEFHAKPELPLANRALEVMPSVSRQKVAVVGHSRQERPKCDSTNRTFHVAAEHSSRGVVERRVQVIFGHRHCAIDMSRLAAALQDVVELGHQDFAGDEKWFSAQESGDPPDPEFVTRHGSFLLEKPRFRLAPMAGHLFIVHTACFTTESCKKQRIHRTSLVGLSKNHLGQATIYIFIALKRGSRGHYSDDGRQL